jgi:hypothetical protein
MGMLDDAKDKLKNAKDTAVNKMHEQKGRMEERQDQAKADKQRQADYDEYEPEEIDI